VTESRDVQARADTGTTPWAGYRRGGPAAAGRSLHFTPQRSSRDDADMRAREAPGSGRMADGCHQRRIHDLGVLLAEGGGEAIGQGIERKLVGGSQTLRLDDRHERS